MLMKYPYHDGGIGEDERVSGRGAPTTAGSGRGSFIRGLVAEMENLVIFGNITC